MPQVIIYTNSKGNVSVCIPTNELSIEEIKIKDTPIGSLIVDSEILPNNDFDFFDAWRLNDSSVSVNLDAAKEITKNRLRKEREPLLQAQDIAYQKADEVGDAIKKAEVIAEKKRLRDITQFADQATTLDELRELKVK